MQCEQLKERLADYWAGALSQAERHAVEAHVAACEPCRHEAAELGETWRALGAIPDEEPSPALESRFHAMLDAWRDGERAATANAIGHRARAPRRAGERQRFADEARLTHASRGCLAGRRSRSVEGRASFWRPALQLAAAVLMLAGGFAAGRSWPNAAHQEARNEVSELRGEAARHARDGGDDAPAAGFGDRAPAGRELEPSARTPERSGAGDAARDAAARSERQRPPGEHRRAARVRRRG